MKKYITFLSLVIAGFYTFAQGPTPYALQFDGVDDYATFRVDSSENQLQENFSFGATIELNESGGFNTILSREDVDETGPFIFGVNSDNFLELRINGNNYVAVGHEIEPGGCYHVAVTISPDEVVFYVDADEVAQLQAVQAHHLQDISYLWIGNYLPGNDFDFSGLIDDVRVWHTTRTQPQIQANLSNINFNEHNITQLYLCSDFQFFETDNIFANLTNPFHYVELPTEDERPEQVEGCFASMELSGFTSMSSSSTPPPATPSCPPQSGPNLVCNGGFELTDPVVFDNQPWTGIYMKWAAHLQNWHITNWFASAGTPDILARGDTLGGGIPDPIMNNYLYTADSIQTWDWSAPGNDVYSHIEGVYLNPSSYWMEAITAELYSPLEAGTQYEISFYAFTAHTYLPNTSPSHVLLRLHGPGYSHDINGTYHTLPNHTTVSGNNGWHHYSTTFSIPQSLDTILHQIEIKMVVTDTGTPFNNFPHIMSSFIDDVSIVPSPPSVCSSSQFPQAIELTEHHNQKYHRYQDIDADDNIYVAGNSYLQPSAHGYFLHKYDTCGSLQWSIPVDTNDQLQVTDMEVDDNGNSYLALYDEGQDESQIRKYDNTGTVTASHTFQKTIGVNPPEDEVNSIALNSGQTALIAAKLNELFSLPTNNLSNPTSTTMNDFEDIFQIAVDANDDVYIAGNPDKMYSQIKIEKLDPGFNLQSISNLINIIPNPTKASNYVPHESHRERVQEMHIDANGDLYIAGGFDDYLSVPSASPAFTENLPSPYGSTLSRTGYLLKFNGSLGFEWGKSLAILEDTTYNPVTSIATDTANNVVIAGSLVNGMATDGHTFRTQGSAEAFVLSFEQDGTYRWFNATQTAQGGMYFYYPQHCAAVNYQPGLDAFVVSGNFTGDSTEIFDHGTLNTNSENNVFVCHALDFGGGAHFNIAQGENGNRVNSREQSHTALSTENEPTEGATELKVYPNPATRSLRIEKPSSGFSPEKIEIRDPRGQKVHTLYQEQPAQSHALPELAAGVYFMHSKSGKWPARKLLIE